LENSRNLKVAATRSTDNQGYVVHPTYYTSLWRRIYNRLWPN